MILDNNRLAGICEVIGYGPLNLPSVIEDKFMSLI